MATGEPMVRPWRIPPSRVSSSASKRIRGPRPIAQAAPGQLGCDVFLGNGETGGQALDDNDETFSMRLTGSQEPEHAP